MSAFPKFTGKDPPTMVRPHSIYDLAALKDLFSTAASWSMPFLLSLYLLDMIGSFSGAHRGDSRHVIVSCVTPDSPPIFIYILPCSMMTWGMKCSEFMLFSF